MHWRAKKPGPQLHKSLQNPLRALGSGTGQSDTSLVGNRAHGSPRSRSRRRRGPRRGPPRRTERSRRRPAGTLFGFTHSPTSYTKVEKSPRGLAIKELLGNNQALNLTRALINLVNFGISHQFFHRVFFRVAITPKNLNRIGGHAHDHVGSKGL